MLNNKNFSTIYVAKSESINELRDELEDTSEVLENLVFTNSNKTDICFGMDKWFDPQIVSFESISEAVAILRKANKYWYLYPIENVRRSRLIESELRKLPDLQRHFPIENIIPEIGCFSLLDKNTLVYAVKRWKKWPLGHCFFIEDKKNPPNRAYLKLWEALTLLDTLPQPGETALDLGASPGGWTYVMQTLGVHVTAVDKAQLDPRIARLPNVSFLQQSAFSINPAEYDKKVDWLLCDVACYPERLYNLVLNWIESGKAKNMICTIKLQGKTDLTIINKFKQIPNSRVIQLFYNKHEVTFFYPAMLQ